MSATAGVLASTGPVVLAAHGKGYDAPGVQSFLWKSLWDFKLLGLHFHITRVVTMVVFAAIVVGVFFFYAFRRPQLVPGKLQGYAEMAYDAIRNGIARDVIGPEGIKYAPYFMCLFSFIFVMNLYEILPVAQFPATSRISFPGFLAIITWVIFNYLGVRRQGGWRYVKGVIFPPGVPWPLYFLLTPIEFFSTFVVRPFTLAVRLFANMFAGHLLILVFTSGGLYLLTVGNLSVIFFPVSFLMALLLTFFELLVITLQAYIFVTLTAVYISGALAEEH